MYKIMTPGPTQVRENVRFARALECTNPDLDIDYYDFYKGVCDKLAKMLNSSGTAYVLCGEGILALEAAIATMTEPGDRVLVIDNGIYGKGFADFVTMYGGEAVLYTTDYRKPVDPAKLREFLEKDNNFKYATVVHCDTPSGVLNPISQICPLLAEFDIMSVVDSVSAMFGEKVDVDGFKIDVLCGGSQKVVSAPPGLSMVWVSEKAMKSMETRKTPVAAFYANILIFKDYYEAKWFPYTVSISDIYGLNQALDNIIADENILERHAKIAQAFRKAVKGAGLSLFLESGFSNTVTPIEVPEGMECSQVIEHMKKHSNIFIAGSFDVMAGKIWRVGHMGESANVKDCALTLAAFDKAFKELGHPLPVSMEQLFLKEFE